MTLDALARKDPRIVVGLISGTSADGIDAAVVRVHGSGRGLRVEVLGFVTAPFADEDRRELFALFDPATGTVDRICRFNFRLGALFARAALEVIAAAGLRADQVDLIGSHGQTIWHEPGQSTLQIGEAAVITERTGAPVVADFRVREIAAGGQGAPLVTYADWALFSDASTARAVQNIGGIANVQYLPAGGEADGVIAFDTGPGNMVVDAVTQALTGQPFDRNGALAAAGRVDRALLAHLLRDPYFAAPPPKTTGRERYGVAYAADLIARGRRRGLGDADLIAAATALTVETIARAYRTFVPPVGEVILCGGGARNPVMRAWLAERLAPARIRTTEEFGLDSKAKEAVAFAILASETIAGRPTNVPSATGARHPVVLGKIVPP